MSSNLVLFSCVVQAVLFGCMVPDTKGEVPSKNYLEWLEYMEIPHITLKKNGEETLKDAYVESKCDHGVWYWNVYKAEDWDREDEVPKSNTKPTIQFEVNKINGRTERDGCAVTFSLEEGEPKTDVSYTLTFVEEDDAVDFAGEEYEYYDD